MEADGKRDMLVPYHNFRVNDPAVRYAELIQPGTLNPDYMRYEKHRVRVIEGRLKPGMRPIYARRELYVDEDSWPVLWADNYDARDSLWRTSYATYFYSQESSAFHRGASVYHDLRQHAYEATYLVNEAGKGRVAAEPAAHAGDVLFRSCGPRRALKRSNAARVSSSAAAPRCGGIRGCAGRHPDP